MKRLKISLSVMALMMGLGGAFATKVVAIKTVEPVKYEWTHYNQSGTPMGTLNATAEEARNILGCPGTSGVLCADSPETSEEIFFN